MSKQQVDEEENNTAIIEIFGGLFALLLVLFVIITLFSKDNLQQRMDELETQGDFQLGLDNHAYGDVVLSYPDGLYLPAINQYLSHDKLCLGNSAFVDFALKTYSENGRQIIFAILEGGVQTMALSRNCLMERMPGRKLTIGWIIADNELLKSVSIGDLPAHIEQWVDDRHESRQ